MTRTPAPPPEFFGADDVVRAWDARADLYLRLFRDELRDKPYDRRALAAFARRVGAGGRVLDVGCGPCGHVTELLAGHGLDVRGIDLSPRCVELARREKPGHRFEVADQRTLGRGADAGRLDGIVSYYSLHDRPRAELPDTLRSWGAAVGPGGRLLVVAKEGTADGPVADPMGSGLRVHWTEVAPPDLRAAAEGAGFRVDDLTVRAAYAEEIASRRIYLAATRTAGGTGGGHRAGW